MDENSIERKLITFGIGLNVPTTINEGMIKVFF